MRLGGVIVIGLALIIVGWRLKNRSGAYGQILQGVGIATLYLTIFASTHFYHLISPIVAFAIMLIIVIVASIMALVQDSLALALFATMEGFLVPILISQAKGSHTLLFGYYALLDLGIFALAWQRNWRVLNLTGFFFTFVIATLWGVLNYNSNLFKTTEPFLILYYSIYLTISILYTLKREFEPKNLIDSTLVFGLPLIAFPLQISLVKDFEYGGGISALVLGSLYLLLGVLLRKSPKTSLLIVSFKALSLIFYTIAIAYLFDEKIKVTLWALEASALLWSSIKQNQKYHRYFAQLLLLLSFASIKKGIYYEELILIASALFSSYWLDRAKESLKSIEKFSASIFTIWAIIIWFEATPIELESIGISNFSELIALLILSLLLYLIYIFTKWQRSLKVLELYWIGATLLYYLDIIQVPFSQIDPFAKQGFFVWIVLNILGYYFLYYYDRLWHLNRVWHILALWFNASILSLELYHLCQSHSHRLAQTLIESGIYWLFGSMLLYSL